MPAPPSAAKHYRWSLALVRRAVREARQQRPRGTGAVVSVVLAHQAVAAYQAEPAVAQMLSEQSLEEAASALLNSPAFTSEVTALTQMVEQVEAEFQLDRLVASLVADAGRAAEQVAIATRPKVGYVRYLNPPSCSRCVVLAGRVYRYSEGFLRHPGDDCTMIPTSIANPAITYDPADLMRQGMVTGLSKSDQQAISDGADFNQVVNVRQRAAGLNTPGRVLIRGDRPTPEGIYAAASSRDDAVERLIAAGYVR